MLKNMMLKKLLLKKLNYMLMLGLAVGLTACSSSETNNSDEASLDDSTTALAQTDPAPADSTEAPAAAPEVQPAPGDASQLAALEATPPAPDAGAPPAVAPPIDPAPPAASPPVADLTPPPAAATPDPMPAGNQGPGETTTYAVLQNDTLMKIAFEQYGDIYQWKKIYEANRDKISDPNRIPAGTELKIEKMASEPNIDRNGEKYVIKQGDTLGTIAQDVYGTKTKWRKIYKNNKQLIKDPNRIFAGFYLYYTMTPEERQQAEELKKAAPPEQSPMAIAPATDTTRVPASVPQAAGPPAPAATK